MIPILHYSWRLVRRYRDQRELRWIACTLLMVIISLTSMTLLSERLSLGIQQSGFSLLGANKVLTSNQVINEVILARATALGLRTSLSISFITMLADQDTLCLAEVKAVQAGYPLLGDLKISTTSFGKAITTHSLPAPGTVWVEQRLLSDFKRVVGDSITLGAHTFKISAILIAEPSKILDGSSYAPMVLINQSDLALTQLADPNNSNMTYSLLLAGASKDFTAFDRWLSQSHRLTADQTYIDTEAKISFIKALLDDMDLYRRIFFRLNLCLAFIVIVIALNRFRISQQPTAAIFRCFGATSLWLSACYGCMLLTIAGITTLLGIFMGALLEYGLETLCFSNIIASPIPYSAAFIKASRIALLTAAFFIGVCGIPMLYHLHNIRPMLILHPLIPKPHKDLISLFMASLLGIGMMLIIQPDHQPETLVFLALLSMFSALVFFALYLFLFFLKKIRRFGETFRSVMHKMLRRSKETSLQIIALSLMIGLSLSLSLLKNKINIPWKEKIRSDSANYFLMGILPSSRPALERFFDQNHRKKQAYYPLTVARLMAIDQKSVSMDPSHTQSRVWPKPLRISSMPLLKTDNTVIEGIWFGPEDKSKAYASLEAQFARYLGLKIGDRLSLEIDQKILTVLVKSIRRVDWTSLEPNFLVMVPEGFLDTYPKTYVTSLYLPLKEASFLKQLLEAFPMLSIMDFDMVVSQMYAFIRSAFDLFQMLWILNLGMSVVLSYFLICCSSESRRQEFDLIHRLGANPKTMAIRKTIEYSFVAVLVCVLASAVAYGISYFSCSSNHCLFK